MSGSGTVDLAGCEFETVIIDEACQSVELSSLIPLQYNCKKCIMVGDPKQLPPTVISKSAVNFKYDRSLFQRIMKANPKSINLLSIQYRMHPEISRFPSAAFYETRLTNAPNIAQSREIDLHNHPLFKPFQFIDVVGKESNHNNRKSIFNQCEIDACLELVYNLAKSFPNQNFAHRIGIISFYKEQVYLLRRNFKKTFGNDIVSMIDINTVDGFQGQEKDIIILSCVRSSDSGNVGFLSDERRINVSLTRAKYCLIVVGSQNTLNRNRLWNKLIDDSKVNGCFTKVMFF